MALRGLVHDGRLEAPPPYTAVRSLPSRGFALCGRRRPGLPRRLATPLCCLPPRALVGRRRRGGDVDTLLPYTRAAEAGECMVAAAPPLAGVAAQWRGKAHCPGGSATAWSCVLYDVARGHASRASKAAASPCATLRFRLAMLNSRFEIHKWRHFSDRCVVGCVQSWRHRTFATFSSRSGAECSACRSLCRDHTSLSHYPPLTPSPI